MKLIQLVEERDDTTRENIEKYWKHNSVDYKVSKGTRLSQALAARGEVRYDARGAAGGKIRLENALLSTSGGIKKLDFQSDAILILTTCIINNFMWCHGELSMIFFEKCIISSWNGINKVNSKAISIATTHSTTYPKTGWGLVFKFKLKGSVHLRSRDFVAHHDGQEIEPAGDMTKREAKECTEVIRAIDTCKTLLEFHNHLIDNDLEHWF
jgi:hypothetical protein